MVDVHEPSAVLRLPGHALHARTGPAAGRERLDRLQAYLAIRYTGVLSPGECTGYVRGVYAGRGQWSSNFDGLQYTLGRAWYTHLEEEREDEYFANAAASDRDVRHYVPGLQERLIGAVSAVTGGVASRRKGWCGPGVHVFPARSWVAEHGGEVHLDNEGLSDDQLEARAPALSLVLMLQPPESGGGLRVWHRTYDGHTVEFEPPGPPGLAVTVPYGVGDLVVFDSYRLHQIAPFGGPLDRISATAHTVLTDAGWEVWF